MARMMPLTRLPGVPALMIAVMTLLAAAPMRGAEVLYVSPDGNAAWTGALSEPNTAGTDGPLPSLTAARDRIRALKKQLGAQAGYTVMVRDGEYLMREPLHLTAGDGGLIEAPIIYQAALDEDGDPEEPVFLGGPRIRAFEPVKDEAVLARMEPSARGRVVRADLKALGVTDYGELSPRGMGRAGKAAGLEFFWNTNRMTLARWPNDDWARIADVPAGLDGGRFTYDGDRPSRWKTATDLWLHGYWTWDWADSYMKVARIDESTREFITEEPHGVYGYTKGKRFYAFNLLEELDRPGEWYLDRATGVLYFWPPEWRGSEDADSSGVVSVLETLVEMDGAEWVTVRNLGFQGSRGACITIKGGSHNVIDGCLIENAGTVGARVEGSLESGVKECLIRGTGEGGIILTGGDRKTLTPAGLFAVGNDIREYGQWVRTYTAGVTISGVGNRIADNWIHDAPHSAILLTGNDHLIEFNRIDHVCMETSDAGAFYLGRDFTERGNVVRHNFFHDLGRGDVQAIYLDDCASGVHVYGNVCVRAGRGVLLGGGRDNVIENNVFVDCTPAIHVDARATGWAKFWFDGRDPTLLDRLKAMNWNQPPYSERYPGLAGILEDEPALPKGNRIERNISFGGRWIDLLDNLDSKIVKPENNSVDVDPGFADPARLDYRIREDSPVFKTGFKPIPFERIGPHGRQAFVGEE